MDEGLRRARLIPVKGIGSTKEAEERATSAFLAVLSVVRPLSRALLDPLGASSAEKATVECFTEIRAKLSSGEDVRPDGLIRVTYGSRSWIALVEVKTGTDTLGGEQVQHYLDVARDQGFDAVITISNEMVSGPGAHPTGLRQRANARVALHHWSWTRVMAEAVTEKVHRGVSDPEQAWLLGELIRYLEHPASGALAFEDMGGSWVAVRDAAKAGTMTKTTPEGVEAVVERWSQLVEYVAVRLGADIGRDVQQVLPRAQRADVRLRHADLMDTFCGPPTLGQLGGALRIPDTVGDLEILADLRAEQVRVSVSIDAPPDKTARGQSGWLLRQLRGSAPADLMIETWVPWARSPAATAALEAVLEDQSVSYDPSGKDAARFCLQVCRPMGRHRKSGQRSASFVDSVSGTVEEFYRSVLQNLRPYVRPAAKLPDEPSPGPDESNNATPIPGVVSDDPADSSAAAPGGC